MFLLIPLRAVHATPPIYGKTGIKSSMCPMKTLQWVDPNSHIVLSYKVLKTKMVLQNIPITKLGR